MKTLDEIKKEIDQMSQFELCKVWRFAKVGDPRLHGEPGDYFVQKLRESGGFTPEISKALGW